MALVNENHPYEFQEEKVKELELLEKQFEQLQDKKSKKLYKKVS